MDHEACPICTGECLKAGRDHRADGRFYTLFECAGCGTQHWSPLVAPEADYYEDEQQSMYAEIHAGERRIDADPRYSKFLAEFASPSGRKLLDVGCADGAFMEAFRRLGNEVVGIDIDGRSLALARKRGLEVHETTLERFAASEAAGRRFDLVTLFDVLEHLTDPKRCLELVRSLLAPNGQIVGTVPNRERLLVNEMNADFPPHHFLRFDRASLERALVHAGFLPLSIEVFQWGYSGPALLNAGVRRLKGLAGRGPRNGGAAARVVASSGTLPRRRLKHRVAGVMVRLLSRASAPIERTLGRGFKLYFVASRGEGS